MGDRSVRGLEGSREVARWAYGADKGDLSEIFKVGKDYVVALLTEIDDDEYASVKKAASQIQNRLLRDKKYDYIVKSLAAAARAGAAESFGSEVTDFKDVTLRVVLHRRCGCRAGARGCDHRDDRERQGFGSGQGHFGRLPLRGDCDRSGRAAADGRGRRRCVPKRWPRE